MTLAEQIPEMSDADLTALHANALRLSLGRNPRSRQAAELLPVLEAEIGARKARTTAVKAQGRPRAGGKGRAKAAAT
jgi:hypothetical protein